MKGNHLVSFEYDAYRDIAATYIATQRLAFEYPREGYGPYDDTHLKNIKSGILGELAFLEYYKDYVERAYPDPKTRNILAKRDLGFCYKVVIGLPDGGHDFSFYNIKADVKTYGTRTVTPKQIIDIPLNLFIDAQTVNTHKADIYIQSFITENRGIILAGYNVGLPPLLTWPPKPAHGKPVIELLPMSTLFINIKYFLKRHEWLWERNDV